MGMGSREVLAAQCPRYIRETAAPPRPAHVHASPVVRYPEASSRPRSMGPARRRALGRSPPRSQWGGFPGAMVYRSQQLHAISPSSPPWVGACDVLPSKTEILYYKSSIFGWLPRVILRGQVFGSPDMHSSFQHFD